LSLHDHVVDRDVISLVDGQWHGVRDFRRDSPSDRSDAGNGNDRTRQDIREQRAATHCSHGFSPCSKLFLSAAEATTLSGEVVWLLATLQVIPTPSIEAHQTHTHLNSNCLVHQSGYSSGQVRVSSYNPRAGHRQYLADSSRLRFL
jgi:hypothetical protein